MRAGQHGPGSQLRMRVRGCPVPVPHSSQNHTGAISQSSHKKDFSCLLPLFPCAVILRLCPLLRRQKVPPGAAPSWMQLLSATPQGRGRLGLAGIWSLLRQQRTHNTNRCQPGGPGPGSAEAVSPEGCRRAGGVRPRSVAAALFLISVWAPGGPSCSSERSSDQRYCFPKLLLPVLGWWRHSCVLLVPVNPLSGMAQAA